MAQRLGIVFRSDADAELAQDKPDTWGSFTLGRRGHHAAGPGQRVRDGRRGRAVLRSRCRYCRSPIRRAIRFRRPNPNCHPAVSADVARAAVDATRCPVGQQSAYGKCDGGTAPEVGALFKTRPVGGKTGSTEDNATETFVGITPQLAAAGIAADPASRADAVGSGVSSSVNMAVANTLFTALQGQPEKQFTAPPPGLAGQ